MAKDKFNQQKQNTQVNAQAAGQEEDENQTLDTSSVDQTVMSDEQQDAVNTGGQDTTDENQDGVPGEDANGSESIVDGENNDTKVEGELNTPSDEVQQENIVTTPVALPEDVEIERIIAVIGNENISVDEKLNTILKSSIFAFSILAGKLIDYRDHMHRDQGTMEIATGAYKNQDLFREIMNVLNNTNDDIYRTAFAIINLTFKTYKGEEEAFNFYSLARYDWGWASKKDSDTFGMLVSVISLLADANTREENKSKIDWSKLRDNSKFNFKDSQIDRMISFYNI